MNLGPRIHLHKQNFQLKKFSKDEIKTALFEVGNNKSLGPDGYTSYFFKKAWNLIEEDFYTASAFVKDRSMVENIHLAQEVIRGYTRKRTSPKCTLKVDIRKAYDTISWEFLENVLKAL
ncbi:hypothetical protein M9H77_29965 [Catharanthus roseus]|uniref:Uncharacterized protein n=1 Tax=Catharanthus roseus TaxID=4058 RepID=A0ACC0A056_CATRO|nr:hypothetical protein M9H77_29965 [Catharanthus roseus]